MEAADLKILYQIPLPKIILTKDLILNYKTEIGNSNILIVIMISQTMDMEIMEATAQTLNYMRQVRILWLVENVIEMDNFRELELQHYHWKNLQNTTLTTFVDLVATRSLIYQDEKKNIKINGLVARMILLFAEYFNATLQMYLSLENLDYVPHFDVINDKVDANLLDVSMTLDNYYQNRGLNMSDVYEIDQINGLVARMVILFAEYFNANLKMYQPLENQDNNISHYGVISDMVDDNLVDIAMSLDGYYKNSWLNMSDVYEIDQIMIMVPLSNPYTLREIFGILLDFYFFGFMLSCYFLISLVYCILDYYLDGVWQYLNLALNPKVFPGILGYSFQMRSSKLLSHKVVYILIGFIGLNACTQFSARMNSLYTTPPYHSQIQTFDDLRRSDIKLLIDIDDVPRLKLLLPEVKINTVSTNITHFLKVRRDFNTSYCYLVRTAPWYIYTQIQNYFSFKLFHTPRDLFILHVTLWGFKLQFNSPLMEPLNYLIHLVHAYGLPEAWLRSVFTDLLKLKKISLKNINPSVEVTFLTVTDLFWIWMLVAIGWIVSAFVFFLELCNE
ncbi:uncharacterized protein LOC133324505 [Musca vetustissima]|uniref:uncharacterized protein LOC133324505 n=1 Tax=Musca vetustissima TaxID=27455 RepID=UPI002AB7055D|nr:uncharacterized protein LOC133324505 [Musca vetustissima]